MEQSVLKGDEIFIDLSQSLKSAKKRIIVVAAWFTDQELLDILLQKQKEGVSVSIVIGENKDNEKLNFKEIIALGGSLVRIKGKGYGMMHQKYCIIDDSIGFHGSYNWTVNAKKNNSDSVIKTTHKATVIDLLNDFKSLTMEKEGENTLDKEKSNFISRFFKKRKKENLSPENESEERQVKNEVISIDEVFKSIISAEIKKTNRVEIKEMAYNQAKEVSGDAQIITKSMDSLYHLFVSDKKENDENKEKLFNKIEDKVSEFNQSIITEKDVKLHSVQIEIDSEQKKIEFQKTTSLGKIKNKETEKKNIFETTIQNKEKLISSLKERISALDIEFVRPMFKYHELIPQILLFTGLSIAMILFYSSSAYIMLYSYEDTMESIKLGGSVNPQVYDAKAFFKASSKGFGAILYIFVFVFIPFTIAYVAHSSEKISFKKIVSYIVVVMIDIFIAIKVSTTIRKIERLAGESVSNESLLMDINFWLVFFLGAIPFFFLAEIMNKLINLFAERNEQSGRDKMLAEKKIIKEKISNLDNEIITQIEKAKNLELEIIQLENEISQQEQSLIFLPKELDSKTSQINQEANNSNSNVRKKADVYKNDIENDNIQISLSSLKDRVSAFIEGWNEWLHDEYAIDKAVGKSQEAIKESDQWLVDNMQKIEV
jgi:hypothetical protein